LIVGVGIDLVNIPKLAAMLEGPLFLNKVFTAAEIKACQKYSHPNEHFAGKFAAKEACMKALERGIRQEIWFTQIEVLNNESGAPHIQVSGEAGKVMESLGVIRIHVSISHADGLATAIVLLEK